jgi:hypothetical protein
MFLIFIISFSQVTILGKICFWIIYVQVQYYY